MTDAIQLLIGTRKGAWIYRSDDERRTWRVQGPIFLGSIVNHLVLDPRDGKTMLMAASTGHLGPTILRSTDGGETWTEAAKPPAFPKSDDPRARAVDHSFWLEPGHASEPGVWWVGTSPPGLFESRDGGVTWESVAGFNDNPRYWEWCPPEAGTPDGSLLNQVAIDPRDAAHMYIATSSAGVFESRDRGASWAPLNQNVEANFLPDPYPEFGQDAHFIALAPTDPDRLWQQNHCGVYRSDDRGDTWERLEGNGLPSGFGFPLALDPEDPDKAYVIPEEGAENRVTPNGRLGVYRTSDAGSSWELLTDGLPQQAWASVMREGMSFDRLDPAGIYLGTQSGSVFVSPDEGDSWIEAARYLPTILSVEAAEWS
jgi:BNR/Asp-box repeat.